MTLGGYLDPPPFDNVWIRNSNVVDSVKFRLFKRIFCPLSPLAPTSQCAFEFLCVCVLFLITHIPQLSSATHIPIFDAFSFHSVFCACYFCSLL